jgi:hypothetical protein
VGQGDAASRQPPEAAEAPFRRAILLGASNLAIHLPTIVETARLVCGGPVDAMIAAGHGRSYGTTTSVLGRVLPSILHCGLWRELESRRAAPTSVLVTDIGNDLLYGQPVEQIAAWVEECLARLAPTAATLAVTELPLETTQSLSERRFQFLRSVLFPNSSLTHEEALTRSRELNARVLELAARYQAVVVKPSSAWYGLDPIHIRRTRGARVWREILGRWTPESEAEFARNSVARWIAVRRLRPLERTLWGRVQRHPQPAGRLPDGTTISLY